MARFRMTKPNCKGDSPLQHDGRETGGHGYLDKYGDHPSSQKTKHYEEDDHTKYDSELYGNNPDWKPEDLTKEEEIVSQKIYTDIEPTIGITNPMGFRTLTDAIKGHFKNIKGDTSVR